MILIIAAAEAAENPGLLNHPPLLYQLVGAFAIWAAEKFSFWPFVQKMNESAGIKMVFRLCSSEAYRLKC
jgi:hypothetical protein